jgi:hypothetical protein
MISFKCQCGKGLKVRDEAAGKKVRCPACKQVIQIPAASPEPPEQAAPKDEADFGLQDYEPEHGEQKVEDAGKHCPECHMRLPVSAVLCTTCGHDFRTGRVYEAPKTIAQRIPWKLIVKWTLQIAGLVLVGVLAWWVYQHMTGRGGEEGPENPDVGGTREQLEKRGRLMKRKPAIRVATDVKAQTPSPPGSMTLAAADGQTTAEKARQTLVEKIAREAADRLRVMGGHQVLDPGERAPLSASEVLTFRLEITVGWAFEKADGKLVPSKPYVASCQAAILRENGEAIWPVKGETATYEAKRPGPEPAGAEAQAVAGLSEATTSQDIGKVTDEVAKAVAGKVLSVVPPPSFLAKLLSGG